MKVTSFLGKLVITIALAGMFCMLSVFSQEVQAEDVIILKETGEPATLDDDYEIVTYYGKDYLDLKKSGLIIVKSTYPVRDKSNVDNPVYTIKGTIDVNDDKLSALIFSASRSVTLYVDEDCHINSKGFGITTNGVLKILPKYGGDSLDIISKKTGIIIVDRSDVSIGDETGELKVNINSDEAALDTNGIDTGTAKLIVEKGAALECSGGESNRTSNFVQGIKSIEINGRFVCKIGAAPRNNYGCVSWPESIDIGTDADIMIVTRDQYAVLNGSDKRVDDELLESLGMCVRGSTEATEDLSMMSEAVIPEKGLDLSGDCSFARVGTGIETDPYAKTIVIRPFRTVSFAYGGIEDVKVIKGGVVKEPDPAPTKDGFDFAGWYKEEACTNKYNFDSAVENDITLYAKWISKDAEKVTVTFESNGGTSIAPVQVVKGNSVDSDTFKSEYPDKTVIATDAIGAGSFFDMKVHSVDARTLTNQKILVQNLVGANSQIMLTESIYPRRDLEVSENGSLMILIWNNLPKNQAGPVSAVVYNQIDGAYVIKGILDANGTATFIGFNLRPASTITICK